MLPKKYQQLLAKQKALKQKWLNVNPRLNDQSGIYVLTRREYGIKYAYVGQAKYILSRLASHLEGYEQHIDKSLKKHGLISKENPEGWDVNFINCPEECLDDREKLFIKVYSGTYQMLNKTLGGQGEGKKAFDYERQPKGYRKGIEKGKKNALKEIAVFFDKYLDVVIKGKTNKVKERKLQEFKDLIGGKENEDREFEGNCLQDIGQDGSDKE